MSEQRADAEGGLQLQEPGSVTEVLPDDGRLLWRTPNGTLREIDLDGLESRASSCPDCGQSPTAPAYAREHRDCGHVALDGFLARGGATSCPKCGAEDDSFPIVATITTCLDCGQVLGSPQ